MPVKIAFIGFGGVGRALAEIIEEKRLRLRKEYGLDTVVVGVSDVMKGAVYHPDGLDIPVLLKGLSDHGTVETYPEHAGVVKGWDSLEMIDHAHADVIVEVTYTNVETGEPALTHCRRALDQGKSVITTNKGPVAHAYEELTRKAEEKGAFFGFEGTVMSGTPALRLPEQTLAGNTIHKIKGILNGTTNYILTEMEQGLDYGEALKQAQGLGYAEADPTSDVEGYDVRYKLAILSSHVFGVALSPEDIPCTGITGVSASDIQEAEKAGKKWRLIGTLTLDGDRVTGVVKPERISAHEPLAGVSGALNAILYDCDMSGPIFMTGAGAGLKETGYALLIDLIHYHKQQSRIKV